MPAFSTEAIVAGVETAFRSSHTCSQVLNGPALGPLLKGLRLSKQNRGKSLMNERMRVLYESIIRKHLSDMQAAFDASHGYRVDWDLVRRVQDVNMPLDTSQLDRRHPQPCNRLWAWLRRPRVFASKTNGEVEGGSNTDVEASTSTSVEAMEGISLWGTKCDLRCLHFLPSIVRHGTSGGEEASPACVERSVSLTPPNVHRHSMPTTESIAVPKHLHASPTAHELIPSPTANAKDAASDARVRLYASLKHRFAQSHASGQISQQVMHPY